MLKSVKKEIKQWYITREMDKERHWEEKIILDPCPVKYTQPLTEAEVKEVDKLWGPLVDNMHIAGTCAPPQKISKKEISIYKYFNGFDPRYLGHELYLPIVSHLLNNYHYTKMFEDKGLLGVMSGCGIRYPYCLIRCIAKEYYDNDMRQMSAAELINICSNFNKDVIWKISRESSGGHSIRKIKFSEMGVSERKQNLKKIFSSAERDWVLQECIEQHPVMAQFNESSLNTFRIITLYLNGNVSHCYSLLRIGQKDSVVDNMCSGGIGVGIEKDGTIHDFGFTYKLDRIECHNGIVLAGQKIEQYEEIIEQVKEWHSKYYPLINFIGWDVCINREGAPVVIEINASQPEIFVGQLNNGPVFGDRTEEVIDYCKNKDFVYNRSLLHY